MNVRFISDGHGEPAVGSGTPAVFDLEHVQNCVVVAAAGEIDLCASPAFHSILTEAAESADRIIDLTGVTFLDSTGLTVMVDSLNQDHHRQRGTLCLVGLCRAVRKVFDITHLTSQFAIYPSVRKAVSELT